MSGRVITIILVLILVGGLAWFINRNYIEPESNAGMTTPGISSKNLESSDNLLYTVTGAAHEIWLVNPTGKTEKIFTDADEQEKIVKFSNVAQNSREVLAVTASNKLISINLDKGKIATLKNSFSRPDLIIVSAQGDEFAYIRFSNVDENYGYTLYLESRAGQNRRALAQSDTEIRSLSFNRDSTEIAYAKTSGTGAEINIVKVDTKEIINIAKFNNKLIDSLAWAGNSIYFNLRDIGANSGEIDKIDANGKKETNSQATLTDYNGGIANFIAGSSTKIAFLVAQYSDKINDSTSGQIYITDIANGQRQPLKKGIQILGWL